MNRITIHDENNSLRVINMDNVREVTFVHRNVNVREEVVIRYNDGTELRLPKQHRGLLARTLELTADDFLTPSEKAERVALATAQRSV